MVLSGFSKVEGFSKVGKGNFRVFPTFSKKMRDRLPGSAICELFPASSLCRSRVLCEPSSRRGVIRHLFEQWFPNLPDQRQDQSRARDFVFRALVNWCLFCARLMPPPPADAPAAEQAPDGAASDDEVNIDGDFASLWKPAGKRSVAPGPPPRAAAQVQAERQAVSSAALR